jgi:hypothetical protein
MHPSLPLITKLCSNFLNHGNARLGGASGFRLKNLNKLADTRSVVRGAARYCLPGLVLQGADSTVLPPVVHALC